MKRVGYLCIVLILVSGLYWKVGDFSGLRAYEAMVDFNQDPKPISYEHLQNALSKHIARREDPLSYLLKARLYFAAKDYPSSVLSFEKAYTLLDKDTGVLVEYATALYFADPQDPRLPLLLSALRQVEDMSAAGHSLLANIAMDQGDHQTAKQEWEALLKALPPDSPQRPDVVKLVQGLR